MPFEHEDKRMRRKFTLNKKYKVQTLGARQVTALKLNATHVGARLMAEDQDIAHESLVGIKQMFIQHFRHHRLLQPKQKIETLKKFFKRNI